MGFRTVVSLSNDSAHEWSRDPELGKKIWRAASWHEKDFDYGLVLECVHADTQTLAVLDGYRMMPIACNQWSHGQTDEDAKLSLLRIASNIMGYRLVKKS